MKVIVAGGAGFIGSHLCARLVEEGCQVLALDNLCTGSLENISGLRNRPNFTFLFHNVIDPLPEGKQADLIFHLASPASPVDYQNLPLETLQANSLGTMNLLNLAVKTQAKFLLASTSECYGDPQVHPQPETYWGHVNPVGIRSCYDESKRFAESLTMAYVRKFGLDARIVRIFNTYGPRMRAHDGRVIPNFICQYMTKQPLTIFGDGSQTRSFCYVDDLVDGLVKSIAGSGTQGEIINLGNPEEFTISELTQLLNEFSAAPLPIVYRDLPEDDPRQRKPVIAKAQILLGWEPKTCLREGLKKTLAWFEEKQRSTGPDV